MRTPAPARRVPPVLHVALDELARGGAQDVSRASRGSRMDERHDVLQLVAKAIGAAGLVERRARPDTTGQRLVEQPAVHQHVERAVRRLDLTAPSSSLPARSTAANAAAAASVAKLRDQRESLRPAFDAPGPAIRRSRFLAPVAARSRLASRRTGRARRRLVRDSLSRARARRAGSGRRCGRGTPAIAGPGRLAPARCPRTRRGCRNRVPGVARQQRAGSWRRPARSDERRRVVAGLAEHTTRHTP